jgi:hypothetical protein
VKSLMVYKGFKAEKVVAAHQTCVGWQGKGFLCTKTQSKQEEMQLSQEQPVALAGSLLFVSLRLGWE